MAELNDPVTRRLNELEKNGLIKVDRPWPAVKPEDVSHSERAKALLGLRNEKGVPIDQPSELYFTCPVCGCEGDGITRSEYKGMLYCYRCNLDIPSCFCKSVSGPSGAVTSPRDRIIRQTEIFLDILEDAKVAE